MDIERFDSAPAFSRLRYGDNVMPVCLWKHVKIIAYDVRGNASRTLYISDCDHRFIMPKGASLNGDLFCPYCGRRTVSVSENVS